jgi:hypothetical protein
VFAEFPACRRISFEANTEARFPYGQDIHPANLVPEQAADAFSRAGARQPTGLKRSRAANSRTVLGLVVAFFVIMLSDQSLTLSAAPGVTCIQQPTIPPGDSLR